VNSLFERVSRVLGNEFHTIEEILSNKDVRATFASIRSYLIDQLEADECICVIKASHYGHDFCAIFSNKNDEEDKFEKCDRFSSLNKFSPSKKIDFSSSLSEVIKSIDLQNEENFTFLPHDDILISIICFENVDNSFLDSLEQIQTIININDARKDGSMKSALKIRKLKSIKSSLLVPIFKTVENTQILIGAVELYRKTVKDFTAVLKALL
jgi:hypothetical protein